MATPRQAEQPGAHDADVVCLGELLIDFVPTVTGTSPDRRSGLQEGAGRRAGQRRGRARPPRRGQRLHGQGRRRPVRPLPGRRPWPMRASTSARCGSARRRAPRSPSSRCGPTASASSCSTATPAPTCCSRPEEVDEDALRAARALHFGSISLIERARAQRHAARDRGGARRRLPDLLRPQSAPRAVARPRGGARGRASCSRSGTRSSSRSATRSCAF